MSDVHSYSSFELPEDYGCNHVVLLARDPHCLFAYWEISNEKKNVFFQEFGHKLWEKSVPVIKVTNVSKNESFFIRINDFSNSWYISVADSDNLYVAEIGRRISDQFFVNLASSNYISTPSESVSSHTAAWFVDYKDLANGILDIDAGKIYESYDFREENSGILGISSPELFRNSIHESSAGISSAELFGINLAEHLGVSSESFLKGRIK